MDLSGEKLRPAALAGGAYAVNAIVAMTARANAVIRIRLISITSSTSTIVGIPEGRDIEPERVFGSPIRVI